MSPARAKLNGSILPMSNPVSLEQLPRIGTNLGDNLLDAIQTVVAARREADDPQGSAAARLLAKSMTSSTGRGTNQYQTLNPSYFARKILPFWQVLDERGESIQAQIPIRQTVGESWRWQPRYAQQIAYKGNVDEFRAFLLDPERAAGHSATGASVQWIRPLGLFLVHEGKNRVAFLASQGEEWMPAWVSPCEYPAAVDLMLFEVEEYGEVVFVCVKDNRYAVIVQHPAWTLPILYAYGVQKGHALIRAEEVLEGIRNGETDVYGKRTAQAKGFDMTALPTPEEDECEGLPQPIATHKGLRVSYRSIVWPWVIMSLILLIGGMLVKADPMANLQQMIGVAMMIGSAGAFIGFLISLQKIKVSILGAVPRMQSVRRRRP